MGDTQEAVRTWCKEASGEGSLREPTFWVLKDGWEQEAWRRLARQREQLVQGLGQIQSSEVFIRELYFQEDGVKSSLEFSALGWPALFLSSGYCHSAGPEYCHSAGPEEAQKADLSLMSRLEEKGPSLQIEISIQITGHIYHLGQTATMVFLALSRPIVLQEESPSHPLKN